MLDAEKWKEACRTGNYEITYAQVSGVFSGAPEKYVGGAGEDGKSIEHEEPGYNGFIVKWGCKHCGFGELTVTAKSDGTVAIHSEAMSKAFCKAVLAKLVDDAKLDGE